MFAEITLTCLFNEWRSRLGPLGRGQCSPATSRVRRRSVGLDLPSFESMWCGVDALGELVVPCWTRDTTFVEAFANVFR